MATLRRKRRSPQQKLADQLARIESKDLFEMNHLMGHFVPSDAFKPATEGPHSRQRIFTAHNTFWGFIGQVLSAESGCVEVGERGKGGKGKGERERGQPGGKGERGERGQPVIRVVLISSRYLDNNLYFIFRV